MRPITCVVAADEPEIAAKIVQPITFTCTSLPGSSPAQGASPWNSDRDRRVRNSNSPIRMNSGNANSSCVVRMFQAYCGSSLSRGIERNIASSRVAVIAKVSPIHKPAASKTNRMTNRLTTSMVIGFAVRMREWLSWSRACSFYRRGPHAMVFERQAERGLDGPCQQLQREQQHPEGDGGLRKPQRRVARGRHLPAHERAPGELDHRECQERHEGETHEREYNFEHTPQRRRCILQADHDADMAAGT